ncbi:IQ and AAA domain-containing protein 1-like [Oryzias melastigma]|uniref:IQ and AAA domain-containing protein 1-like n=1 Tax=Oryzias melastigma TaxID=30732 RepID=A0A834KXG2_ORYME|nr:IQ and AAA domain-containing protein 1-like [Oryzias melastigma]
MCKMYNKSSSFHDQNYGSRYIMWKELINQKGGEITKALDLSALAKISDGYTPGPHDQSNPERGHRAPRPAAGAQTLTAAEFRGPFSQD